MFYDPDTDFSFVQLSNMWDMKSEASFNDHAHMLFDIAAKAKQLITADNPGTNGLVPEQNDARASLLDFTGQFGR